MKHISTIFLRLAVIFLGLIMALACIFFFPGFTREVIYMVPALVPWKYIIISILCATAIPFFLALWQTFRLLHYIDKNTAFSQLSIQSLRSIRNCAIAVSTLLMLMMPVIFLAAEADDAPGAILMGFGVACTPLVVATFAAVLQKLLQQAIDLKTENDLTV